MGALHRAYSSIPLVIGLTACLLLTSTIRATHITAALNEIAPQAICGYTSLEERITEYLFDGEEPHPMWA